MNSGHAVVRPLLQVTRLSVRFTRRDGGWPGGARFLLALDRVSFEVMPGEVLGVVGESGSGKTTLARAVAGLIKPEAGAVVFDGVDITRLPERKLRGLRRRFQLVFQDPYSALDPRLTVAESLAEPLEIHFRDLSAREKARRISAILEQVGLSSQILARRPHELSGGQCQRVVIARALVTEPALLICDEPTSALDASVQAQILNLLAGLRTSCNLTYLFITHDIPAVACMADRLLVMFRGRVVEIGPADSVISTPLHPYTKLLLSSVPGGGRMHSMQMESTPGGTGVFRSTAANVPFTGFEPVAWPGPAVFNQPTERGNELSATIPALGGTQRSGSPVGVHAPTPVIPEPGAVSAAVGPGITKAGHFGVKAQPDMTTLGNGQIPAPAGPAGCAFMPRCALKKHRLCERATPELVEVSPAHWVACHVVRAVLCKP